jgi:hypothetical protein
VAIRQEGWQKNWGRKIRVNATFNFSALIFLPVEGPGADKLDQTENY